MARGNMLQGMARGKMGDVVFYRQNGEQLSRVRVRSIKNPKTNKQLAQRAVMSTVMQAYSAGKEIFDHSFQGLSVGQENMSRFMSRNAKWLRQVFGVALSEKKGTDDTAIRLCAPGVSMPVPNEFIISEGTYPQRVFTITRSEEDAEEGKRHRVTVNLPAVVTGETIAQYADRNGLIAGDLYTFVCFSLDGEVPGIDPIFEPVFSVQEAMNIYPCSFTYARLQVKSDIADIDTVVTADTVLSAIFDITLYGGINNVNAQDFIASTISNIMWGNLTRGSGSMGIIRSRIDRDLRSNTQMVHFGYFNYGLSPLNVLPVWSAGASDVGNSDFILEGGSENPQ